MRRVVEELEVFGVARANFFGALWTVITLLYRRGIAIGELHSVPRIHSLMYLRSCMQ
jgi:hypothetical protein